MLVVVDDSLMWTLLAVALGGCAGFGVLLLLLLKAPAQVRQLIGIWFHKEILDISATGHNTIKFIGRKANKEGQYEKRDGHIRDIKVLPRGNPLHAFVPRLDGTGISAILSYEGKTLATTPEGLAAMAVAEVEKKEELPESVKQWAEENKVKLKELVRKEGEEPKIVERVASILSLNPLQLMTYAAEWYDANQFTHMLEESRMEGKYEGMGLRRKGMGSKVFIILAMVLIGGAVAIFLLMQAGVIK